MRIRGMLLAKWQTLRNTPKASKRGWAQVAMLGAGGLALWLGLLGATYGFVGLCLGVEPIGELLVDKIMELTLLVVFSALVFSNVVHALSTLCLADDLALLLGQPVDVDELYAARFVETCVVSGWAPWVFALPVLIAVGARMGASWGYYAVALGALSALVVIATEVAVPVVLALVRVLPAQRTREALVILGVLGAVGLVVVVRALSPEEVFDPARFGSTMEVFAALQSPSGGWLPSAWAVEALRPLLRGEPWGGWVELGALVMTASAGFFGAGWAFRWGHGAAYDKAQEGRHEGTAVERVWGRLGRRRNAGDGAQTLAALRAGGARPLSPGQELARKDGWSVVRDPTQWSQLILLGALIAVYLIHFRGFGGLGREGIVGPLGLYMMNLTLCGFVIAGLGVRFVFPAVSLEGAQFWYIQCAPITMTRYLRLKWYASLGPVVGVGVGLALASNVLIGMPWSMTLGAVGVVAALGVGVTGLGVGLGARYPRFDLSNAAKIATGFGGLVYMVCALGLVVWVVACVGPWAWAALNALRGGMWAWSWGWAAVLGVTLLAGVGAPAVAATVGLRVGARHLDSGEL